jgi:CRISPR-associated protein Cas1
MFRTVIITRGETIRVKDNWLVVISNGNESKIPIGDIYSIVVDNISATISASAISILTNAGAHILICDDRHIPSTIVIAENKHFRPYYVLKNQINLPEQVKLSLWDKIVAGKISNQAAVLKLSGVNTSIVEQMLNYAKEVEDGDGSNREAVAAKLFFKSLYGSNFVRMNDDGINAALNYGYTIIRAAVAKTLAAYGFNCVLGLHHIGEGNAFNLADDLMEPFRPVVDLWVYQNSDMLVDDRLGKDVRTELIDIVNKAVVFKGKQYKIRTAIDKYIQLFSSAVDKQDSSLFQTPSVIDFNILNYYEDEE